MFVLKSFQLMRSIKFILGFSVVDYFSGPFACVDSKLCRGFLGKLNTEVFHLFLYSVRISQGAHHGTYLDTFYMTFDSFFAPKLCYCCSSFHMMQLKDKCRRIWDYHYNLRKQQYILFQRCIYIVFLKIQLLWALNDFTNYRFIFKA